MKTLADLLRAAENQGGAVTANRQTLAQALRSRQAFDRPQVQGARGALDYAAGVTAAVPVIGDLFGFGSDIARMRAEPSERTPANIGLAAAGLLPFVPRGAKKASSAHNVRMEPDDFVTRIEPPHEVRDVAKFENLVSGMQKNGWQGRPVLAYEGPNGVQGVTGSHRIAAAQRAGVEVPVVYIESKVFDWQDPKGLLGTWFDAEQAGDDVMETFLRNAGDKRAADLMRMETTAK
jgi:hypothetical protein